MFLPQNVSVHEFVSSFINIAVFSFVVFVSNAFFCGGADHCINDRLFFLGDLAGPLVAECN